MHRINLISGPRNISTALMYSFAQRKDTHVLDEPFYAFYLHKSGVDHPGKDEIMQEQPIDEKIVLQSIFDKWDKDVLFIKNMAHHIELMDENFLNEVTNIFLIRNPHQIIASYAQVIENPIMRDIGIEFQYQLFNRLVDRGQQPLVIDSGVIVQNPEAILKKICQVVGIPFTTDMLHWQTGPKPYDGIWAKYWYANVHSSSGFEKQPTSTRTLPPHLEPLNDKARHFYEKLLAFSLNP
ncbi:MAG TPA: sulfotransferase family protein [Chryseolinea sp.]|nr:sulfotransferase family protein [Chryseolinea sp.]HPM30297.1 sulfotransferase family protein [Chryseolinea sp.]